MTKPKTYKSYMLTGAELALARANEFDRIRTADERTDTTEHEYERNNPRKKRLKKQT